MRSQMLPEDVIAELCAHLERKRTQLHTQLQALRQAEGQDGGLGGLGADGQVPDRAEEAADLVEREQMRHRARALRSALAEVEHALEKRSAGTLGLCEACGRPIRIARLRVLPEARYDVEHQAEVEARPWRRAG